ncbi:precorrin-3B synthase [Ollibium composti]|uniref:Precorrin-3B synthase n=1 Tax=Ollibium composti TaxID=2675109 RepID=A0ABY2QBK6_9HYPH|nr:precorrin-3B synthase [Mesorhizobium composti]THF59681.1 precorrin-3B synthase [Mesorhizobium composti]
MTGLAQRRGACPALSAPMQTGDGLLVRLNPVAAGLPTAALIGLCESAARHGNGIMEITQRGSIQIRGLTSESASLLADDVNALGISVRTGVPVETSPLAGIDPDETADPHPLAEAIRTAVESAGLPRRLGPKISVVVDGGGRIGMGALLADIRLTAVRREQETYWHLAVGGTADTARPVGLFAKADAVATTLETLEAIAALGREGRGRNIVAGHTPTPNPSPQGGGESHDSQAAPDGRNDGADLSPSPLLGGVARLPPLDSASPLGTVLLANATHALGIALPFGSMPAETLAALARAAADLGATEIRAAPGRMLLLLSLTAEAAATLQAKAAALDFVTDAADPRLFIAACPGAPACTSAHMGTRPLAGQIAQQDADLLDGSFTLHVSGCAKGCAHPGTAALTLVGGENGAGLVVNGTAKTLPAGYASRYDAARGIGRLAALVDTGRRPDETAAACLARLGAAAIATDFAEG